MKAVKNKKKTFLGFISISILCVLFSFSCKKVDKVPNKQEEQKPDLSQVDDTHGSEHRENYQPQFSKDNRPKESVDPFTAHNDFETLLTSNKNKTDFDFDFPDYEGVKTYTFNNESISFKLKGSLRTIKDLANVSLTLAFYNNNQISYTRREETIQFDLSFIQESEKESANDKFIYRFDFQKDIQLAEGVHYFLIQPTGRNRVLYAGKFLVKENSN